MENVRLETITTISFMLLCNEKRFRLLASLFIQFQIFFLCYLRRIYVFFSFRLSILHTQTHGQHFYCSIQHHLSRSSSLLSTSGGRSNFDTFCFVAIFTLTLIFFIRIFPLALPLPSSCQQCYLTSS